MALLDIILGALAMYVSLAMARYTYLWALLSMGRYTPQPHGRVRRIEEYAALWVLLSLLLVSAASLAALAMVPGQWLWALLFPVGLWQLFWAVRRWREFDPFGIPGG